MPDAPLTVSRADRSQKPLVANLLELYCYDMAEWFLLDTEEDGSYAYPLDEVWTDDAHIYLAWRGTIPVGFALVESAAPSTGEPGSKDLVEFFVVRRHRRNGIGQAFATQVWNQHPGRWLVRVFQGNLPAIPFWRGVIAGYTLGQFREEVRTVEDRKWLYFTFATAV